MPLKLAENFFLGRSEHGIEPAQNGHREHDALVLGRAIRAAQQIRDLPDEIGQFVMIGHGARIGNRIHIRNTPCRMGKFTAARQGDKTGLLGFPLYVRVSLAGLVEVNGKPTSATKFLNKVPESVFVERSIVHIICE